MANFKFVATSNMFKTKDNKQVENVFNKLGFEETYSNENGVFFGSYGEQMISDGMCVVFDKENNVVAVYDDYTFDDLDDEIREKLEDEDDTYSTLDIYDYLQNMLLDGEVVLYTEIGNEKLRDVHAFGLVISKYEMKDFPLEMIMEKYAENMKK